MRLPVFSFGIRTIINSKLRGFFEQGQAAEILRRSSLSLSQQKQLFANIYSLPYAIHAISGGKVDPDISKKIADKVSDTRLVLKCFQQYGTFMPYDIQKALIDAFAKSNESEADKSNHAFQLTQLVGTQELYHKLIPYIQIGQKHIDEISSDEASYFISHYEGVISTPVQIDLLQKINNSEDYAIALGSGRLSPDLAEKISRRIFHANYVSIALASDPAFSDAVWTNLIRGFKVTNSIKDKLSCVQAIKSNVNLSPEFKTAILEDLSNIFSAAISSASSILSDEDIELLANTLLANEELPLATRNLVLEYKDNIALASQMNGVVLNMDPVGVFGAAVNQRVVQNLANDNLVGLRANITLNERPKSIDDLLKSFARNEVSSETFLSYGIQMLSETLETLKGNANSIHFHFSTLVSLAKVLGENLEDKRDLLNILHDSQVGRLIARQVETSVFELIPLEGFSR